MKDDRSQARAPAAMRRQEYTGEKSLTFRGYRNGLAKLDFNAHGTSIVHVGSQSGFCRLPVTFQRRSADNAPIRE